MGVEPISRDRDHTVAVKTAIIPHGRATDYDEVFAGKKLKAI